jgi:hypothetical protein
MNNSTKVRIRVPKHLYESIQAELNKKQAPMEEMKDEKMEESDINEYVGMSPDQMEIVDMLGKLIASGALTGMVLKAANIVYNYFKSKKSKKASGGEAPMAEEKSEVVGEVDQLAEAIKKVLDKKKEAKKKAAEAEKEKAAKDKEKAAKEKEAEAKKKAAEAKKKADAKKK